MSIFLNGFELNIISKIILNKTVSIYNILALSTQYLYIG